jgi:hypothetical protein
MFLLMLSRIQNGNVETLHCYLWRLL